MIGNPSSLDRAARARRYQRKRLWCGIVGIGLILNLLWWGTFCGLTRIPELFPAWPMPVTCGLTALTLAALAAIVQLPVDLYAQRVEREFAQTLGPTLVRRAYVARTFEWIAGVGVAGAAFGLSIVAFGRDWPFASGLLLAGIGLAPVALPLLPAPARSLSESGRDWLDAVRARLAALGHPMPAITFVEHGERSLAGGWHGTGPWRTLVLSTTLTSVPPELAAGLILREVAHRRLGHRLVSVYATILWTVLGVLLAGLTAPAWVGRPSQAGLVVWLAMVMSTWSWLGLFVWPALGRRQILAADAFAARAIGTQDALAMLDLLADRNLPDESLPPAVAWTFHPIPPMQRRRDAIAGSASPSPQAADVLTGRSR